MTGLRISTRGWLLLSVLPFALGFFSIPLGIWWTA